jgi:glyoxylase-like metal-dependent hydrolase (beta-lactamase superfamily II)
MIRTTRSTLLRKSGLISFPTHESEAPISLQVLPVTNRIWCVRRPSYLACSYLVETDKGIVAIDAGMDSGAADIFTAFKKLDLSPTQLTAVLLTHWHNDHAAGAAELKARLGVAIHYATEDAAFFTRETAAHGFRAWFGEKIPELGPLVLLRGLLEEAPPRAVAADSFVRNGDLVAGLFRVLATPGHTPGHVAYFHENSRTLFCGDALAVVGNQLRLMARPVTPDLPTARQSALSCIDLNPQFICPGHRAPLIQNVPAEIGRLRAFLNSSQPRPLLG